MEIYMWRLLKKDEDIIVQEGVIDHSGEIFCDVIIPEDDSSCDRDLSEMQEYIDNNDYPYRFEYQKQNIEWMG